MKSFLVFLCVILSCTIIFTSCFNSHSEKGHEHEHHITMTAYNGQTELYAEISPMVAGKECSFTAHFTRTDSFKPVAEDKLTAIVRINDHKQTYTIDKPQRPGIYKLNFTPKEEGAISFSLTLQGRQETARFDLNGLTVFTEEDDAHEDAESREIHCANGIVFPKEMSWNIVFSTAPVEYRPIGNVIHTVAQIQPAQGDEITVCAKVNGLVTLSANDFTVGKAIQAGQPICRINASATPRNNLQVQQAQAEAEYNRAKSEYERIKQLESDRLVTSAQLSDAKGKYKSAEAIYKNLKENFSTGIQSVNAPRGGFIQELMVKNGEYVFEGQPLLTITQVRSLRLVAQVPSRYFNILNTISNAVIYKINSGEKYTLESLGGKVISYGKQVSNSNWLIPVTFEINNTGNFLSGSYVDIHIITTPAHETLSIPTESLLEDMGNYFVYVQLTPELFEKRPVNIGANDGQYVEITDGLHKDERIVNKGAIFLKMQQASGTIDPHAGHNH